MKFVPVLEQTYAHLNPSHPALAGGLLGGCSSLGVSLIDVAIFRYLLFALTKARHNRRSPWYQRSLIREPLRKISVILSDDIQRSFLGQLTMVLRK
jgi:hypothetical protein